MVPFGFAKNLAAGLVTSLVKKNIIDYNGKHLRVSGYVVSFAAEKAISNVEGLTEPAALVNRDSISLSANAGLGLTVHTEIIPELIQIDKGVATVELHLPKGIFLGHKLPLAPVRLVANFVDRLFGIVESKVNSDENIEYDGKSVLRYRQRLDEFALVSQIETYIGDGERILPLSISDGWLEIDISGVVPDNFDINLLKFANALQWKEIARRFGVPMPE